METTTEEWRDVKGYEGLYRISNKGNVQSLRSGWLLTNTLHHGTYVISLLDINKHPKMFTVHYLVAVNFVDNPNNFNIVVHKDGNKLNNVPENLQFLERRSKKEIRKEPEDLEGEIWKEVDGYDGMYKVSNLGRIKSYNLNKIGTILKPRVYSEYDSVVLTDNDKSFKKHMVHRLVATAFIPNPNNYPEVNHLNGNKHDNLVENLEWCTHQQNVKHAYNVLYPGCLKGEGCPTSKLKNEDVLKIYEMAKEGKMKFKDIGKMFGVTRSVVTDIHTGKSWTHITNQEHKRYFYLTEQQAIEIYKLASSGLCKQREISEKYNISTAHVSEIKTGRCFSKVIRPLIEREEAKKRTEASNTTLAEFYSRVSFFSHLQEDHTQTLRESPLLHNRQPSN